MIDIASIQRRLEDLEEAFQNDVLERNESSEEKQAEVARALAELRSAMGGFKPVINVPPAEPAQVVVQPRPPMRALQVKFEYEGDRITGAVITVKA